MSIKNPLPKLTSIQLGKRKEFVLITAGLTAGLVASQVVPDSIRYWVLLFLTVVTYGFSAVGLREDLKGVKWITLLILPALFTASVGLFYFLLPVRWLTRLPVGIMYAIGIYALLLVENIYSVAVNRSIQLLRVAHAVGFLVSLLTLFLLLNTLYSLRLDSHINMALVMLVSFPLIFQSLWSINLEDTVSRVVVVYTLGISWILAQTGFIISFWPLKPIIVSIFITTLAYALIGITHQYLAKRLFHQNIVEYMQVVLIVTGMILLTTSYR